MYCFINQIKKDDETLTWMKRWHLWNDLKDGINF